MFEKFLNNIFGNNENQEKKHTSPVKGRKLNIESLESREMLSISPADYDSIRAAYPDLNLSVDMADYNVIEITSAELTARNLQAAIDVAAKTTQDDVIVVRTTADNHTISLSSPLSIDIDSAQFGSAIVVGFGDADTIVPLKISQSNGVAMSIAQGEVTLAGITFWGEMASYESNVSLPEILSVNDQASLKTTNVGFFWQETPKTYTEFYADGTSESFLSSETANLAFSTPWPWSDSVILSAQDTFFLGDRLFGTNQDVQLGFAVSNMGAQGIDFGAEIWVDGQMITSLDSLSLGAWQIGGMANVAIGHFNMGTHTVEVVLNASGQDSVSYTTMFTVTNAAQSLAVPENVRYEWDAKFGAYLLRWDAVAEATRYCVETVDAKGNVSREYHIATVAYMGKQNLLEAGSQIRVSAHNGLADSARFTFHLYEANHAVGSWPHATDPFNIDVRFHETGKGEVLRLGGYISTSRSYVSIPDPIYIDIIQQACARWEEIITQGLPDDSRFAGSIGEIIDDLWLDFGFFYEQSSTLASSWNGEYRTTANGGLPVTSQISYNTYYYTANPSKEKQEEFYYVVLHEIGHSLGYRTSLMDTKGLIATTSTKPLDAMLNISGFNAYDYYIGTNAVREFNDIFGNGMPFTSINGKQAFLMETVASSGSFGSHFSTVYSAYFPGQSEFMKWTAGSDIIGISTVTIGMLDDLGYSVDYAMADPYGSIAPTNLRVIQNTGNSVSLAWDMLSGTTSSSFEVYRRIASNSSNNGWTLIGTTLTMSYIDTSVSGATQYEYHVVARGTSNVFQDVKVEYVNPSGSMTWTAVSGATNYSVYQLRVDSDDNELMWYKVSGNLNTTSYNVGTSIGYGTYYHVVANGIIQGESAPSRAVRVNTGASLLDLVVSNGGAVPDSVVAGNVFNITTGAIKNAGGVASGNYTVTFYASTSSSTLFTSGINLGSVSKTSLAIGGTTAATLKVDSANSRKLAVGTSYYIGWVISGVSGETNAGNNTGYRTTPIAVTDTEPSEETPSTIVTTLQDVVNDMDNLISLREAIDYAGTGGLGTTITFASSLNGKTIVLGGTELTVGKNLTIDATGANITVDADQKSRAFYISSSATVTLVGLTITNGQYDGFGGGIYNTGTVTLTSCEIVGNSATYGGGVANSSEATLSVMNSTVAGNSATDGGGIENFRGTLTVTNSTIAGNSADHGGGIDNDSGTLTINNTIVAKNTSSDVYNSSSGTVSGSNNLIGNGTGQTALVNGVSGNIVGTAGSPIDPKFASFTSYTTWDNNLWKNWDLSLAGTSPAIDKGSNQLANSAGLTSTSRDMAGNPRFNGTIDIGAYEYASLSKETPSTLVTTLQDVVNDTDNLISLREAITYAGTGGLGTTITFASSLNGKTIVLGGTELTIGKNLTIDATGANIIVDANQKSRAFNISSSSATVMLVGLTITNGQYDGFGGGIYNYGTLTLTSCEIVGNSATYGGGVANLSSNTLTITNCTIAGNSSTSSSGGIYNYSGALTVTNSTIQGNSATGSGGGIYNSSGTLTVTNSTVAGNSSASSSGGIYNYSGALTVTNCTIAGNSATGSGGGIYNGSGTLTVTNSTVAGNSATSLGGGIYTGSDSTLTINNTIVAKNTSSDVYNSSSGTTVSGSNSLIGNGTGQTALVNGASGNIVGTTASPIDPKFVSFTSYTTWDKNLWKNWNLSLAGGSPAIDKGSNQLANSAGLTSTSRDMAGNPRFVSSAIDIGAYENQAPPKPDLASYKPDEWGSAIIVTTTAGATQNSSVIYANQNVYVRYAYRSTTNVDIAETFYIELYLNDTLKNTAPLNGLNAASYGRNGSSGFDLGKLPAGTYTITVKLDTTNVVDESNEDNNTFTTTFTVSRIALSPPTGFNVTDTTTDSISVVWNEVSNATGYKIQWATNAGFTQNVGDATVSSLNYTIPGLSPGQGYYIRVMAIGNEATHINSGYTSSIPQSTDKIILGAPKLGNVTALSSSEIQVEWGRVDNASGYTIEYATNETFTANVRTVTVDASSTSKILTGLSAFTKYYVHIRANGTGAYDNSAYSTDVKSATTEKIVLGTPTLTKAEAISCSEISMEWNKVDSHTTGYTMEYATDENFTTGVGQVSINAPATSGVIPGLNDLTTYYVRVKAVGSGQYADSEWSNVMFDRTVETPTTIVTTLEEVIDEYDGKISLREAIAYAGTSGLGTVITFAVEGTLVLLEGEEIVLDKDVTIDATGKNITIDANKKSRVFNVKSGTTAELVGLTITKGMVTGSVYGGGIYNEGTLAVTSCVITNNSAERGGGIFNYGGTLTVTGCIITENSAGRGGGIRIQSGTSTVTDSTISKNKATSENGGGIDKENYASATVIGCEIIDNWAAKDGGGVYGASVRNSTVAGNAAGGSGGGIYNGSVTNCTVTGNSAYSGGGISGISNYTVTNCTITGNTASSTGGGISSGSRITVTNSTISGNSANTGGGIHYSTSLIDTLTVTNCTIAGNFASGKGGGIYNSGYNDYPVTVTLQNSILAQNTTSNGVENLHITSAIGTVINATYTLIDNTTSPNDSKAFVGQGNNILGSNPLFVKIPATISASNTGRNFVSTNWDLRLQSSSPAVNKGNNQLANNADLTSSSLDVVGYPRFNGTIDMGANEYGTMTSPPNLAVSNGGTVPSSVVKGNSFSITTGAIKNIGNAASGDYTIKFYASPTPSNFASGILLGSQNKASLVANGTTFATFNVDGTNSQKLVAGTPYYIGWVISDVNGETVTNNNTGYCTAQMAVTPSTPNKETQSTVVTTLQDVVNDADNLISLREAISYAGTNGLGTTITFANSLFGNTIVLGGTELVVGKNITIDATGANITVDANKKSRVFNIQYHSTVTLVGLTIANGQASGDFGGGIYNEGELTMTGCVIANSSASYGGGIANAVVGTLTVTNSTITTNSAVVFGDTLTSYGGGIYTSGTATVTNSTIAGNSANSGGGIYTSSALTVTNSTIAGNSAGRGGGICTPINTAISLRATVTNSTIAGNSGEGIYNGNSSSSYVINNTIIAKNTSDIGRVAGAGMISGENNLVGNGISGSGGAQTTVVNGTGGNIVGTTTSPIDPRFVRIPATINSTTTGNNYVAANWNLSLAGTSPAVNKGSNELANAAGLTSTSLDMVGNLRFKDTIDMGAYEYGSVPPTPTEQLAPPTSVTVSATNSSMISVNWSSVQNATGYTIQYATDSNFSTGVVTVQVSSGTQTSRTLDGLSGNTTYHVRVLAKGNGTTHSDSVYSETKNVTTPSEPISQLIPPTLGTVEPTSSSTISVNWSSVQNATGYTIQYATNSAFTTGVVTVQIPSGTTTRTLDGLSANTEYYVRIMAKGNGATHSDSNYTASKSAKTPNPNAPTQKITAKTNVTVSAPGSMVTLSVFHEILNPLPGKFAQSMGLVIHYDPACVEYVSEGSTFYTNGSAGDPYHDDVNNTITIGWNNEAGNWPGTADITELLKLNFTIKRDAPSDRTVFRIETNSPTVDFNLVIPDDIVVAISPATLDIDGSGDFKTNDANLMLRYLFGYSGNGLITGLVANNAERNTVEKITQYLEANESVFDIDGDGVFKTNDVNLMLRYLFGYSGNGLITGLVANNATRKTADSIVAYIKGLDPAFSVSSLLSASRVADYPMSSQDAVTPTQQVSASADVTTAKPGETVTLKVFHEMFDPEPGKFAQSINIIVHYDSAYVEYDSAGSTFYPNGKVGDLDHSEPNSTIAIGWNDPAGNWPGTIDIIELLNLKFTIKANAPEGNAVFRVVARNETLNYNLVAPNDIVVAVTSIPVSLPEIPTGLGVKSKTTNSITMEWNNASDATGYELQYRKSDATQWETAPAATLASDKWSVTVGTLTANTPYEFRVQAKNEGGVSAWSATVSVTTLATNVDNVGDIRETAKEIVFANDNFTFTDKLGEGPQGVKDVDMYMFVVSPEDVGKTYTFTTSQPVGGAAVDTYMRLFNATSTGTTEHLAFNDDISGSSNRYSEFSWEAKAAGTYYLGVSTYGNKAYNPNIAGSSTANGTKGDYTLTVTRRAVPAYTDNVGDTRDTAKEIVFANDNTFTFADKLGEGEQGAKDVDMYKLVVSADDIGKIYTFATSQSTGGVTVDTYMRLFNATSTGTAEHLAFNDDISGSSNRYSKITWIPTAAGTYYLGVSTYGNKAYNPNAAGSRDRKSVV